MSVRNTIRRRPVGTMLACGATLLALAAGGKAVAAERQPTVVELFTSQGCSSCPPANANLARISDAPGILALSFGVTYWDRLGWKDTFARQDYTERQIAYEAPLGEAGPFTPQIVVGGQASVVGNDLASIERLIAKDRGSRTGAAPAVALRPGSVTVEAGQAPPNGADVWLVRYDPRQVEVPVRRGENQGRTLPHKNVVHGLTRLGHWTGVPLTKDFAQAEPDLRTAVPAQAGRGARILAAASD